MYMYTVHALCEKYFVCENYYGLDHTASHPLFIISATTVFQLDNHKGTCLMYMHVVRNQSKGDVDTQSTHCCRVSSQCHGCEGLPLLAHVESLFVQAGRKLRRERGALLFVTVTSW